MNKFRFNTHHYIFYNFSKTTQEQKMTANTRTSMNELAAKISDFQSSITLKEYSIRQLEIDYFNPLTRDMIQTRLNETRNNLADLEQEYTLLVDSYASMANKFTSGSSSGRS
jgi:hypothetical protein